MKYDLIRYDLISNSNGIRKYGFYYNLKNKHKIKNYFSPTIDWSHGWDFFHSEIFSDYRAKANKYSNFVVPNIKEKNNLEKFTRNTVYLDCLPFYYYYKKQFKYPNNFKLYDNDNCNLLVFPGKMSFDKNSYDEFKKRKIYFEFIKEQKKNFSRIIICIPHNESFFKEYIELINSFNFDYITGPDPNDKNSYFRLLQILSLGNTVTTNCLGSILVYAAVLSKKISISGPIYEPLRKLNNFYMPKNFDYSINAIKDEYKRIESIEFIKEKFSFLLFSNPSKSNTQLNWGLKEIGAENFESTEKAVKLLGIDFKSRLDFYGRKISRIF
jgi:hypothetical protein